MGIAFGLASSLVWGTADFLGGVFTRRLTLASVTVGSQVAGLVALLAAAAVVGGFDARAAAIGLAAGACGAVGISAFYRALATGTISIVSPVSACGALVPVVLALATGERPGALALTGCAVALAGAVLASVHEIRGEHPAARSSIGLALLALLCIGVLVTRSSIAIPRAQLPMVASIGLLDTAANGLFAVATQHGYIAVVSVLGSEYPVVTVILAHTFLGERITPPQWLGVALALTGVGMVAAA
jgi:drug/metabolite transporter (DMT)-like permease